jgi:RimJ/RimL family protein N-acetyltransferase
VAADADDLLELLEEPQLRDWLSAEDVAGLRDRFRRWESRRSPDGGEEWLNWVVRRREDREAVGWVQATLRGERAEIAYAVVRSQRGRGYSARAVGGLVAWLRARPEIEVIEAHIAPENAASAAVARSVGLRPTEAAVRGETVWVSD